MNPQERAVIDGIFERLRNVANQPRDAEVERYIADLVRQQPYAPYAMAQSIYVQEQALLNQQREIEQMQGEIAQMQQQLQQQPAPQSGGFLSGIFGGGQARPAAAPEPVYGQRGQAAMAAQPPQAGPWAGQPPQQPAGPWAQQPAPPQKQGMGFLGTAATAAAGVAGGMMLGSILSSAFGGGQANAATGNSGQSGQNFLGQNPGQNANQSQNANHSQGMNAQGTEPDIEDDDDGYDNSDDGYDDGGGSDSYDV